MRITSQKNWILFLVIVISIIYLNQDVAALKTKGTQAANMLAECASPRELPTFGSPFQQPIIEKLVMQNQWVAYSVAPQQGTSQFDIVLFNAGRDKELFTPDDGRQQFISGTDDVWISSLALADNKLFWIQDQSRTSPQKEVKECQLPQCDATQRVVFTRNSQYDVEGHAAAYKERRAWIVSYVSGSGYDILMWCSHAFDGSNNGCLPNDQKQVQQLGLNFNEQIVQLETTTSHAYITTFEQVQQTAEKKLYIFDYATGTLALYYSLSRNTVPLAKFAVEENANTDLIYLFYNNHLAVDFIGQNVRASSFQNNFLLSPNALLTFATNKESALPLDLAFIQSPLGVQGRKLVNLATQKSYELNNDQPLTSLGYNGEGYVAFNSQGMPIYATCE